MVSVNIPTLNSSATLTHCLKAIRNQTYKNIEVIVIDSYSSDDTVEIALKNGARVYNATGLLQQRLLGIKKSKGKYILLLDSDQILEKTAIEECVKIEESLDKPESIILNEISIPLVKGLIANAQAIYVKTIHKGDWDPLLGTALPRFFPAKILKEIRPARREIGYFDHQFIYRRTTEMGVCVRFANKAIVYHYEMNTPKRVFRKFYRYYGFYIIPAFVEDSKLIFSRILPRRSIFKNIGNNLSLTAQLLLYGVKALATSIGALNYIFSSIKISLH
jgi:glycosyltransferase involved in cell wall biosynthesis